MGSADELTKMSCMDPVAKVPFRQTNKKNMTMRGDGDKPLTFNVNALLLKYF